MTTSSSVAEAVDEMIMQVAVVLEDFVQQLLILEVVVLLKVNYQLAQDHIAS